MQIPSHKANHDKTAHVLPATMAKIDVCSAQRATVVLEDWILFIVQKMKLHTVQVNHTASAPKDLRENLQTEAHARCAVSENSVRVVKQVLAPSTQVRLVEAMMQVIACVSPDTTRCMKLQTIISVNRVVLDSFA